MTNFYLTQPIVAEQFDGDIEMVKKYHMHTDTDYMISDDPLEFETVPYLIETLEGWVPLTINDWIATGVKGEYWVVTDNVFRQTYAELPMIPKFVADWIENCHQLDSGDIATVLLSNDDEQPQGKFADYTTTYVIYNANTVARAWLDGYQVEEYEK